MTNYFIDDENNNENENTQPATALAMAREAAARRGNNRRQGPVKRRWRYADTARAFRNLGITMRKNTMSHRIECNRNLVSAEEFLGAQFPDIEPDDREEFLTQLQEQWDLLYTKEDADVSATYGSALFWANQINELIGMYNEAQNAEKITDADVTAQYANLANTNAYHPVIELLKQTEWDGVDRLPELYKTLGIEGNSNYCNLVYLWLKQAIAMLFNDGSYGAEGVLIFQGKQGIGKTRWFNTLAMSNAFFKESVVLADVSNKDTILRATAFWICELGELDSTTKRADCAALKAFLTDSVDVIRAPYAREAEAIPRRTCFCGGCNELTDFLADPTGNRRFWVLKIDREIDVNGLEKLNPVQVWAQIYREVSTLSITEKAACFRPNREAANWLKESNKEFTKELPGVDELRSYLDPDLPEEEWTNVLPAVMKERLPRLRSFSTSQFGRAAGQLGYTPKKHTKKGNEYVLPLSDEASVLYFDTIGNGAQKGRLEYCTTAILAAEELTKKLYEAQRTN